MQTIADTFTKETDNSIRINRITSIVDTIIYDFDNLIAQRDTIIAQQTQINAQLNADLKEINNLIDQCMQLNIVSANTISVSNSIPDTSITPIVEGQVNGSK